MKRGRACSLQLVLDLASAVNVSSESRWTRECILCLKFETPHRVPDSHIYIYVFQPETECPSCTPRHCVPFTALHTAAVLRWKIFDPPQHGVIKTKLNSMVRVRERTIPTERPPLVVEVIANFCG
jgi:hypothetical protein